MKRPYAKCSYYCMKLTAIDKHFNIKGPLFFFLLPFVRCPCHLAGSYAAFSYKLHVPAPAVAL